MQIELNYKSILQTRATPMTPLYTGSWNPRFATKWLGVAAELSYNPYLRNGWVSVDTGVKGAVGSPLIEFSTWEEENSTYNIIIPNSFSYSFFFKGEHNCVSKFLTRSSVEAQEWWFGVSGVNTILNLWGQRTLTKAWTSIRGRTQLSSLIYLNYRFSNFNGTANLMLAGLIPASLNGVSGVNSDDLHLRDLSINFLYLNQIVKHRLARIRFYLYEKTNAAQTESSSNGSARGFFSEHVFFFSLSKSLSVTSAGFFVDYSDSIFFRNTATARLSFDSLVGGLSTTLFLFLEYKESSVFLNFFFLALKKIVEDLVLVFSLSHLNFKVEVAKLKAISLFIVRRLFKFILTTRLSAYSVMVLLLHAIQEFVSKIPLSTVTVSAPKKFHALLSLYSYKLRQLSFVPLSGSPAADKLNSVFQKNVVLGKDLLTSYAKHRGRGLRMFRRGRAFFSKKRRFNFIGRQPKYYFSKKRNTFDEDPDAGFTFSRRLNCLRRALKFSSTSGQFTFLFFWSFQFFNFNQLNLKKRKFFFLTMRVAYFFKSFLRFFKFYAFYFRLLRDWDLPGKELYSATGEAVTNLKVYCILLFAKFAQLLVNFREFCSKIFLLKWRRLCVVTLNEIRYLKTASTNLFVNYPAILTGKGNLNPRGVNILPLSASLTAKFLVWSYAAFNGFIRRAGFTDSALKTRYYLRYLLKLRSNYLQLYMRQFYTVCAKTFSTSQQEVPMILGQSMVRGLLLGLFNLPLNSRFAELRRAAVGAVRGVFAPTRNSFLLDSRELYTEIERGLLTKISFSALRRLTAACILRRKFLKRRTVQKVVTRIALRFKAGFAAKVRLTKFIKFLSRLYNGSIGLRFSLLVKRISRSPAFVNANKPYNLSLFLVKRYLLIWKTQVRTQASNIYLSGVAPKSAQVVHNSFRFLFFRKPSYFRVMGLLPSVPLFSNVNGIFLNSLRPKPPAPSIAFEGGAVDYQPYLNFFPNETLQLQLDAVVKILHFAGEVRSVFTPRFSLTGSSFSTKSLFFRRNLDFTHVFCVSKLFDTTNPYGANLTSSAVSILPLAGSSDFFIRIWGSYLALNVWAGKVLPLFLNSPGLPIATTRLRELYGLIDEGFSQGNLLFPQLVRASSYLNKQFVTLNSFLAFSSGLLRNALFETTLGLYAKSFFMRNFSLQKNSYKFVRGAFSSSVRLLNLTYRNNFFSFAVSQHFSRFLISALTSRRAKRLSMLSIPANSRLRKINFFVNKYLSFNNLFFEISPKADFKRFDLGRRLFCQPRGRDFRNKRAFWRYSSLRSPVNPLASRVFTARRSIAFRKACRGFALLYSKSPIASVKSPVLLSKKHSIYYLKTILRLLHQFTPRRTSSVFGLHFSVDSYSLRVGRFFNVMRGVPPLRLLTYAKKIGIWPRNLRLRPKRIKPKPVMEINVSKNKQSLIPDKNFKMPPSIFSRENYESMNLILDFPHDDYKFARVNMQKWAKAWRFTRRQLIRSVLVKIKRKLKIRYFRRTFRYRKFLRKRWFRKKLKKAVFRTLVRVISKLTTLTSLRLVYRGGACLKRFTASKLYYSPALTYSLVLERFLSSVYSRFLRTKFELRWNFMRTLKLQFLFLLIRSFFAKTLTFFSNFTWTYRLTFGGDFAAAWFFNKLSTLTLAAPRMYAFGASYYWSEPLAVFNSKLMGNYVDEDFFKVRVLPDYYVIRTIGPEYYPYDTLISTLPWRTNNVGLFEEYPAFLLSNLFSSVITQTLFGVNELRSSLENLNVFSSLITGFFTNCGFRLWLPARRRGNNKVVHATPITPYNKPARRAQIIRLVKKLLVLRPLKLFKKFKFHTIRRSRMRLKTTDYISSPHAMFELLHLRPLYVTLFKRKLKRSHYRLLCRAVRVIADAHKYSWPSKLKVFGGGSMYTSNSKIARVSRPKFSIRRRKLHWRVRKTVALRQARLQGLRQFRRLGRPVNIYTRVPKWKRPALFTYTSPARELNKFSNSVTSRKLPVWKRVPLFVRRIRRAQRAQSRRPIRRSNNFQLLGGKKSTYPYKKRQ